MTPLRIISALLLAVVLAVGAFAGFWYLALRYAELTLANQLGHQLGATITYGKPEWVPALDQMDVVLPNVDIRMTPPGAAKAELHLKMPQMELVSSFFDADQRLVIRLPQQVAVQWRDGGHEDDYSWLGERTEVTLLRREQGVTLLLRAPTNRLVAGTSPGGPLVLQFTEGFMGWFPTDDGRRLELGLKQVATQLGRVNDVYFSGTFTPGPDFLAAPLIRLLHERSHMAWQDLLLQLDTWFEHGGQLAVTHAMLKSPSFEVAAYGQLGTDPTNHPLGDLTVTANNSVWLAKMLQGAAVLHNGGAEQTAGLAQVMGTHIVGEQPTARMVLHQGTLVLNGQPAGLTNTYQQMFTRW